MRRKEDIDMSTRPSRLVFSLTTLLVISALVFLAGITAERSVSATGSGHATGSSGGESEEAIRRESGEAREPAAQSTESHIEGESEGSSAASTGGQGGETGGEPVSAVEGAHVEESTESTESAVLGINPESNLAVAVVVALTLLLAAAVWLRPTPVMLGAVAVFAVAFAVLDAREIVHQAREARLSLAALASLLALLHVAIAALAVGAARKSARQRPAAAN